MFANNFQAILSNSIQFAQTVTRFQVFSEIEAKSGFYQAAVNLEAKYSVPLYKGF